MSEQYFSLYGSLSSSLEGEKNYIVATASEWDAGNAWNVNLNNGNGNNNNKTNTGFVRPVAAYQDYVYNTPTSFFDAAESCDKNKRSSADCIEFSLDASDNIVRLWRDAVTLSYEPSPSDVFIVPYPVKREVFGAQYRDRVVHHWIAERIDPLLEARFKRQYNVSKNCRKGFGCLTAVKSLASKIYSITEGYTKDVIVIRLDIKGFFMSIDKDILWWMYEDLIMADYHKPDKDLLLYLLHKTIYDAPQHHFIRRSPRSAWDDLPSDKSLMGNDPRIGIAIGKLPSQLSANFYMSVLVDYLLNELKVEELEMFMDDFVILDSKGFEHARAMVSKIKVFCKDVLHINLHPKKIYIQPYQHGVLYVGAMIKPNRIYISKRTLGAAYRRIHFYNSKLQAGEGEQWAERFVATINSYLGLMIHYNTYNKRKKLISLFDRGWYKYIYVEGHFKKIVLRKQFRPIQKIKKQIKMAITNNSSCQNSRWKWVPIQQLPSGAWLLFIRMEHIIEDTFEIEVKYHRVEYFHRPTLDDIKRTCHRIAMCYLGEINYNPEKFDFSPYMVY